MYDAVRPVMVSSKSVVLMLAFFFCLATALVGCAPAIRMPNTSSTQTHQGQIANPASDCCSGQSSYGDPFGYCAAVGTIDAPDGRYNGVAMPDSIIQAMIRQGIVSAAAPKEFLQNAVWRCMNNEVWVCHYGADIPCLEKADFSRTPTSGMEDFCKTNPAADSIPAAVTGRATVYQWGCRNGKAMVIKQLFKSDPQGYLADFWHELRK